MAFIYRPGLVGDVNINGTNSNDTIIAGPNNNIVSAGVGNDYVLGENGDDILNGDRGNDFLFGENGDDTLNGNEGNDSLFGQSGKDSLTGGSGQDFLAGGIDADTLTGGSGADIFFLGSPLDEDTTTVDTIKDFEWEQGDKIQVEFGTLNQFTFSNDVLYYEQTALASLQSGSEFIPSLDISIL